ncbi:HlyD family type I secretion periplasmic adaptor subunit [Vogesella alkaliphila]|uniref:Membrane fusion protein (MFP) family protein n=1 Tax=Vogesella alkaliphila TaxID=1193621 RepID=A0ABQ2Z1B3_9NEIS|nr:HlyD family type I secretion periplasmic adaptor subunit [Vogesella alkaliphila]GGX98665.1 HlyD family type I secretion periplasmic adaptor subunit [Vogesella alkaliphila]
MKKLISKLWENSQAKRSPLVRRVLDWTTAEDLQDRQDFAADAEWAILEQNPQRPRMFIWVIGLFLVSALLWSAFATLDEVARGEGKVVPTSQIQHLQSLDGGVVSKILVKEGDIVERGQLLLQVDNTRFVSSLNENQSQVLSLQAKASRLRALAEGKPFSLPQEVTSQAPEIARQEMDLYQSKRMELDANVSIARQQLAQRTEELNEARARREQANQGLELTMRELTVTRPLLKSGAVSEVDVLRLERDVSRYRGERDMANAQVPKIQSAIGEANRKIQEVELAFRNQASTELSETLAKLSTLGAGSAALQDKVNLTEIRSPVRGEVKRLLVNTVGGVVQPGRDILEIVPLDDSLLIEAKVSPRDIAFLHPGQPVFVRFTAYDSTIYGGLKGKLHQIGADSITDDKGNTYYVVKVKTDAAHLSEKKLPIIPGMVAEVDIITGHKSVLNYLLKPVLRAKAQALSER